MQIISGNRVYLDKGEVIPCFCECGKIYQPERDSEYSQCPTCNRINNHQVDPSGSIELLEDDRIDYRAA